MRFYINYPYSEDPDEWDWLELGWRHTSRQEIIGLNLINENDYPGSWGSERHANYKAIVDPGEDFHSELVAIKVAIELGCRDAAVALYKDLVMKVM